VVCAGEKVLDSIASPQMATRGSSSDCFLFGEQAIKNAREVAREIKIKFFILLKLVDGVNIGRIFRIKAICATMKR
jgi:hypothetical protein